MKVIDVIFALVAGLIIGFLVGDFLHVGLYWSIVIWLVLPFVALFCLWLAYLIGRKFLFVFQGAKHVLVGIIATVLDLKFFGFLDWLLPLFIFVHPNIVKAISFIFSTFIKYCGNKYWAFSKHERQEIKKEMLQFFAVALVGLLIDVASFHYFTNILGPQFSMDAHKWERVSVILAAIIAALWNFPADKLLVFKK